MLYIHRKPRSNPARRRILATWQLVIRQTPRKYTRRRNNNNQLLSVWDTINYYTIHKRPRTEQNKAAVSYESRHNRFSHQCYTQWFTYSSISRGSYVLCRHYITLAHPEKSIADRWRSQDDQGMATTERPSNRKGVWRCGYSKHLKVMLEKNQPTSRGRWYASYTMKSWKNSRFWELKVEAPSLVGTREIHHRQLTSRSGYDTKCQIRRATH